MADIGCTADLSCLLHLILLLKSARLSDIPQPAEEWPYLTIVLSACMDYLDTSHNGDGQYTKGPKRRQGINVNSNSRFQPASQQQQQQQHIRTTTTTSNSSQSTSCSSSSTTSAPPPPPAAIASQPAAAAVVTPSFRRCRRQKPSCTARGSTSVPICDAFMSSETGLQRQMLPMGVGRGGGGYR